MNKNILILSFFLLLQSPKIFSQPNVFTGTWQVEYLSNTGMATVYMELQIAYPEKNILFPAKLTLQCDSFKATYELLLVKKNSREIAISKNKYPVSEKPFSLGDFTFFINGIFDFSRDLKGEPTLTIQRFQLKHYPHPIPDTAIDKSYQSTAAALLHFLKDADIKLYKTNGIPWQHENIERVLSPSLSPVYFGITDTIHVPLRSGVINLNGIKKSDTVSVVLNGQTIIEQIGLNRKPHTDDILLDTGLNILVLFADNFGEQLPNKGKLKLQFGNKKFNLDFNRNADSASSFIVAKLYYDRDKEKEINFQDYRYPGVGDKPLQENEKLVGSIVATSKQVVLAIWDDAVEDGDSISININGEWIAKGFPVKKIPQFITVTLKPGGNTINFIADNLGSIPPNTSVLEIIDGKKRKSYTLETTVGENNLVKIFYDLKPDR